MTATGDGALIGASRSGFARQGPVRTFKTLKMAFGPEAELTGPADDDVIVQRQPEGLGRGADPTRHVDVGGGWRGVSGRVIVHQDEGAGVQFQSPLDDFARIDGDVIDRALRLRLVGDEYVLAVQVENAELFGFA